MDRREFEKCLMPLYRDLYAYSLAVLGNESDACDCVQETYTKLWECRQRLTGMENPQAYCVVTARRMAIDMLRRRSRHCSDDIETVERNAVSGQTPEQLAEAHDSLRMVSELLGNLPERQRKVVVMSGVAGFDNDHISRAMGLTADNVRVLLSRGRKRLRQLFKEHDI